MLTWQLDERRSFCDEALSSVLLCLFRSLHWVLLVFLFFFFNCTCCRCFPFKQCTHSFPFCVKTEFNHKTTMHINYAETMYGPDFNTDHRFDELFECFTPYSQCDWRKGSGKSHWTRVPWIRKQLINISHLFQKFKNTYSQLAWWTLRSRGPVERERCVVVVADLISSNGLIWNVNLIQSTLNPRHLHLNGNVTLNRVYITSERERWESRGNRFRRAWRLFGQARCGGTKPISH